MSVQTITSITCDRCKRSIKKSRRAEGDAMADFEGTYRGKQHATLFDLCASCDKVVASHFAIITTYRAPGRKSTRTRATRAEKAAAPGANGSEAPTDPTLAGI